MKPGPLIIRLTEATPQNAGAKAAVLGRLTRAGFAVPPAFVIPVAAYRVATAHLDLTNPHEARQLVESQPVSPQLVDELTEVLAELGNHPVAVRSSATTEDTPTASAAGQHDSYLGVQGVPAIAAKVQAIWASLWSPRAIAYRAALVRASPDTEPGIAVLIQRHIDADVAGVLFTADPRAADTAVLESSWGLGESVVQGLVTPDTYTLTAAGVLTHVSGPKQTRRDRVNSSLVTTEVPAPQQHQSTLTDAQARQIIQLGQEVAAHLGAPQDIEFALENHQIWLLQSRPITAPLDTPLYAEAQMPHHSAAPAPLDTGALTPLRSSDPAPLAPAARTPLDSTNPASPDLAVPELLGAGVLRGVGGSPGVATGPARIVNGIEDFNRVKPGDILVCRFTDPAWTPLFSLVAGVITEVGGRLSHAAIVAREHRIPAVLGVPNALKILPDNHPIRVEGATGLITPLSSPNSP